ncbi:glutamate racemase [Flavipsychrobacter stenotrophus]|uniref:Glutamate racemase n=1 Tax=Flavipsychrobacter stenotrophus TaxID=2077091 RepID=A0A2S7SWV8_9BACT|nr:glutamate racemase [Flavipsychrobacter stenotrophus]PQJ11016.1 glutamate racemase [Flavipsychrobacter stenotrophus]
MDNSRPIGIFDSGYGGLTVFKSIVAKMPHYDYVYLGDNARAPYGNRSFETVHEYTLQCVKWFFEMGCPLVILACNTASAKALRTIQQQDLPDIDPAKRVLGVIRPTAEIIGDYTKTRSIGVLGTRGTVTSGSYEIEINKFFPDVKVHSMGCPMWVPLIENGEYASIGADYFVEKYLDELMTSAPDIDTILLACTHYPLLMDKIRKFLPAHVQVVAQGGIVADSLSTYLDKHTEMEQRLTKSSGVRFFTTDDTSDFDRHGSAFFGRNVQSEKVHLK